MCYGWGSAQHEELYLRVAASGRLRTTGQEDLNQEHGRTALHHSCLPLVPLALPMVFWACLLPTSCAALRAQAFLLCSELPRWRQKREAYCAQKQNGVFFFLFSEGGNGAISGEAITPSSLARLPPSSPPPFSFFPEEKVAELKRSPVTLSVRKRDRGPPNVSRAFEPQLGQTLVGAGEYSKVPLCPPQGS